MAYSNNITYNSKRLNTIKYNYNTLVDTADYNGTFLDGVPKVSWNGSLSISLLLEN